MERKKGYERYKEKGNESWNCSISESLLTPEKIKIMRFQGYEFEKDYSHIPNLEIPKPPKNLNYKPIKKSEMTEDTTYILCPDKKCGLFWYEPFFACEGSCPKKDLEKLVVICKDCDKLLVLDSDHSAFCRLDHNCNEHNSCKFRLRKSTNHILIYALPKSEIIIEH